jgi:DNA-binding XRE family transcriptional regulator
VIRKQFPPRLARRTLLADSRQRVATDVTVRKTGNNLFKVRQERGLSAAALARSAGISRQAVYALENGQYVPSTAVALTLARSLQVSVEEIFLIAKGSARGRSKAEGAEPKGGPPCPLASVRLASTGNWFCLVANIV